MSVNKFFWYMREREAVRRKREQRKPFPWTRDAVLQRYRFCNVFREDDAVTKYLVARYREAESQSNLRVVVANLLLFRLFNLPSTWAYLSPRWDKWEPSKLAAKLLDAPRPLFNSAYMVTGSTGKGQPKHVSVIEACETFYNDPEPVLHAVIEARTLQAVSEAISQLPMCGMFMGYEVACDLETLRVFEPADALSWANKGPGAHRGLNRIHRRPLKAPLSQEGAVFEMRTLLSKAVTQEERGRLTFERPLTMRAIEHSLCEFDKYCRVTEAGSGHGLRKFST